jgi:hypothetical protein
MRSRFQEEAELQTRSSEQQHNNSNNNSASQSPLAPREKDPSAYSQERSSGQQMGKSGPLPSSDRPLIYLPQEPDVAVTQEESGGLLRRLLEPNCISSVFEEFLGAYVLLERRNLEDMLDKCVY